jgi:hypothetical protein
LQAYLNRLNPGGMLAITRWVTLPPRDALKLFGTALAALEANGADKPGARLVMIRGWNTATLLVKNESFTTGEIAALQTFVALRRWCPGPGR